MYALSNSKTSYVFRPHIWVADGISLEWGQRIDTQATLGGYDIQVNEEDATPLRIIGRFLPTSWTQAAPSDKNTPDGGIETRRRHWLYELDILRQMLREKEEVALTFTADVQVARGYLRRVSLNMQDLLALAGDTSTSLVVDVAIDMILTEDAPELPDGVRIYETPGFGT